MDVPFRSSGAMSRANYSLVRKVETASVPQAADMILLAEFEAIQNRLLHSTLNLKQVKESLIILLYCATALSTSAVPDVSRVLPYAISLAEAGKRLQDKRIGYLFCAEMMPHQHELQLMLVNTFRKDLDGTTPGRICLALDVLIHFSPEDVAPAIQDRLYELLSHNSPQIRRRALLVYRTLSKQNIDILKIIVDKTRKRFGDADPTVVSAAINVGLELVEAKYMPINSFHAEMSRLLHKYSRAQSNAGNRNILCRVLEALLTTKPTHEDVKTILHLAKKPMKGLTSIAFKYQCFQVAATTPEILLESFPQAGAVLIQSVRHLLTSRDMNDIHIFLSCIDALDPKLWAGTIPEIPAVLEAWEVERIMQLLESSDTLIRKQTLHILTCVDRTIVEAYFSRLSSEKFPSLPWGNPEDGLRRPLEIIEMLNDADGEGYAQQVLHLLHLTEDSVSNKPQINQGVVEDVLTHIRRSDVNYRSGCLGVLFTSFDNNSEQPSLGPTLLTILSALACDYLESSPISPSKILSSLCRVLPTQHSSLQDVCLLTMMRVSANCDEVSSEVVESLKNLRQSAGRHVRRRCEVFLKLLETPGTLRSILAKARSSSLPDFLVALETYSVDHQVTLSPRQDSVPSERSVSRTSQRSNPTKLRYAAYESPRPTSKLRRMSSSSSHSTSYSDAQRRDSEEALARTLTPGDLALVGGRNGIEEIINSPVFRSPGLPNVQVLEEEALASRVDLISLESPFMDEVPAPTLSELLTPDFEQTWNSLASTNSRGWSECAIDVVVRKLQSMQLQLRVIPADQSPFQGDLKVTISPKDADEQAGDAEIAVLRLKESEDNSCLWHLRCQDSSLLSTLKSKLAES